MKIRSILFIAGTGLALAAAPVLADVTYTQGSGTTIFDFICFTTKHCSGHVPINSAGTEIATSAAPFRVDPTGTTPQPATQSGTWTVQPGNTANTTAWLMNVGAINGVTPLMGNGVTGTGSQRVTIASDNTAFTVNLGTLNGASTAANQATEISSLATIATNSALPLPTQAITVPIGSVGLIDSNSTTVLNDPCQTVAKTYTTINVVTATNTIITGVSAKKKYVCGIFLYPAGTVNIGIFQATTATACATALVGVIGGTTTATGIVATAQAGFVLGNGASSVAATTVNQTDLCIVTSAAIQVSGVVVTVDR